MARKQKVVFSAFGREDLTAEEVYYLNNKSLPTQESVYEFSEEMLEAMERASRDIIFFAENFFTIIARGKRQKIKLRNYQKKFLQNMANNHFMIMLTSRQIGKTTLMTIFALWMAMFNNDQTIIMLANNDKRAKGNIMRIKLAYEEMEGWIKAAVVTYDDHRIKFANGSVIDAMATSPASARGDSATCILLDELAFVPDNLANAFWDGFAPSLSENPDAKLFISSTPNGIGNLFHKLCMDSIAGENDFILEKLCWYDVEGRGEDWKEKAIRNYCHGDLDSFRQEFECEFLGSSVSPFNISVFERLEKDIRVPIKELDNGNLKIWALPENNRVYAIGVDVAEGVGADASVVQVFDMTDLKHIEQVACYFSNTIDTITFAERVYMVAEMYGKPVMAVERNGPGVDVCSRLYNDKSYPNFVTYGTESNSKTFRPGIQNSQNTRGPAVTNLKYWLQDATYKVRIYDKRFVEELRYFERTSNGVWKAQKGYHDDIIMATVWALFVLHRNLVEHLFIVDGKDSYGVPRRIFNRFDYNIAPDKDSVEKRMEELLLSEAYAKDSRAGIVIFGSLGSSGILPQDPRPTQDEQWALFRDDMWEAVEIDTPLGWR